MSNSVNIRKLEENIQSVKESISCIESAIKNLGNVYHLESFEALKDESKYDTVTKFLKNSIDRMDKDSLKEELQNIANRLQAFDNNWSHILHLAKALEYKEDQQISKLVSDLLSEDK